MLTAKSFIALANPHSWKEFWLKKLGPGLIAGAADDDPSGIATYSQAGAQFGFGMLWSMIFTYPLMVGIQMISARIGWVTCEGLATNMRQHYSKGLLFSIVGLLLIANTVNIAADISAMSAALQLIIKGQDHFYAILIGLLSLWLQVFIPYSRYVHFLKWLTLALLAYVATVFVVKVPWLSVIAHIISPDIIWRPDYITTLVAVFGTTISPYLFFWQASQEVEEQKACSQNELLAEGPAYVQSNLLRIKIDTFIGMGFSNIVAFFVMLTTAVTLHVHGITTIQTSADAASALRPLAGEFAFILFSMGIVGTGLLAIPILAGSAAYALAETFKWKSGLELKFSEAKEFYSTIIIVTVVGIILGYTPIDPIQALYWSAVINGVIAVPIMIVMMLMGSSRKIMGPLIIRGRLKAVGWLCSGVMVVAVGAMFLSL